MLPLFPGYMFARAESGLLRWLLQTSGVRTVVKNGERPAMLSDQFVQSLRSALDCPHIAAQAAEDPTDFAVDDEVLVREGPLAGLRGVVRQLRGASQFVIWIQEIGRGVAFTMRSAVVSHGQSSGALAESTRLRLDRR